MKKSDKTILILFATLIAVPVLYYGVNAILPKDPVAVSLIEETITNIREGNLPTSEEVQEIKSEILPEDYQRITGEIFEALCKIPYEDGVKEINTALNDYLSTQTILPLDHYELEFSQDTLILVDYINSKPFDNIHLLIKLHYDPTHPEKRQEIEALTNISNELFAITRSGAYGFYKVHEIEVKFYDLRGMPRGHYDSPILPIDYIMLPPQSDEEISAQTFAFDYVKQLDQVFGTKSLNGKYKSALKRFGFAPESDTLLVEIALLVVVEPGDKPTVNDNMERVATELVQQLKNHPDTQTYLADNQARSITITFHTPWQQEVNHEFSFTL